MSSDIKCDGDFVVVEATALTIKESQSTSLAINLQNPNGCWSISGPRSYESNNNLSIFWNNNQTWSKPYFTITDAGEVTIGTLKADKLSASVVRLDGYSWLGRPRAIYFAAQDLILSNQATQNDQALRNFALSHTVDDKLLINRGSGYTGGVMIEGNLAITGKLTEGCSRELKENITELPVREATEVLKTLNPVKFKYKADAAKMQNLGFIAEDVPDLVATADRKGLSSMDIVAVLTKVVQEQQKTISELSAEVEALKAKIAA